MAMSATQIETIRAAGPTMLHTADGEPSCGLDETYAGWYELLLDVTKDIELELQKIPEDQRGRYHARQIKTKFGGLCVYMSEYTPAIHDIIAAAWALSEVTCETCGQPGKRRGKGFVFTACEQHATERPT